MIKARWPASFVKRLYPDLRVAAAHTWQFLSSKINNTSLISPEESEKLLNLMKKNFREDISVRSSQDGKNLAEHHFSSLLANPIFGNPASRMHASKDASKEVSKVSKKQFCSSAKNYELSLERPQQDVAGENPAIAMTEQCLKSQNVNFATEKQVSNQCPIIHTPASKAALSVSTWWWSSTRTDPSLLLFNRSFVF